MNNDRIGAESLSVIKLDTSFGYESSCDFSLPDYMPEIGRLLGVTAVLLPEGKFLNGSVLELDGTLAYSALYIGDDGSLTAAPLTTDYSADTALPAGIGSTEGIVVDTELEGTTCRATGPRDLNIKSRLRFRVTCDDAMRDGGLVTGADGGAVSDQAGGVERMCEDITSLVMARGGATSEASGTLSAPDGAKPLTCRGALDVTSASYDAGGVKVTGDVFLTCIFEDGTEFRSAKTALPFEVTVPIDTAAPFSGAAAWGRVATVSVAPSNDDPSVFDVTAEFDIDAEAFCTTAASVTLDAYSTSHESENEYRECDIPELIASGSRKIEASGEVELKRGADDAVLLDLSPGVCRASVTVSDGALVVLGDVKIRALINSGGEIYVQEAELPFRAELGDAPEGVATQDLYSHTVCTVVDLSGRIAGGGLSLSCQMRLAYTVCRRRRERVVTQVMLSDEIPRDAAPCVRVYYPDRDESVWSVAKKYRADRGQLMKNNTFDGEVAREGCPVIIF